MAMHSEGIDDAIHDINDPDLVDHLKEAEAKRRPIYKLAGLMAEMPDGLPRMEGWDNMPPIGREEEP